MARFKIETDKIEDWESFHSIFAKELKFFDGYGRNMDAWIDCMGELHSENSLSYHQLPQGESVELVIMNTESFSKRCPEILQALVECTAFVNNRYKTRPENVYISLIFE